MGLEIAMKSLELKDLAVPDIVPVKIRPVMEELLEQVRRYILRRADVVVWSMDRIQWGIWDGQSFHWCGEAPEIINWQEIRIFNRQEELHLRWTGDALDGRFLQDKEGTGGKAVDSFSRFWGKKSPDRKEMPPGFVCLQDVSRKLKMALPFQGDSTDIEWFGLTTRNYVGSDEETGLSGYVDYRFVAIESAQGV